MQRKLKENLKRHKAYKAVLSKHSFSKLANYKDALNANYSYSAMKQRIKKAFVETNPVNVREKMSKRKVHNCEIESQAIIERNLHRIEMLMRKCKIPNESEDKDTNNDTDTNAEPDVVDEFDVDTDVNENTVYQLKQKDSTESKVQKETMNCTLFPAINVTKEWSGFVTKPHRFVVRKRISKK